MFDFPKYGEHGKTWVYSSASVIASAFAGAAIEGRHFSELVQESYKELGFEDRSGYVSNAFNELSAEGWEEDSAQTLIQAETLGMMQFTKEGETVMVTITKEDDGRTNVIVVAQ